MGVHGALESHARMRVPGRCAAVSRCASARALRGGEGALTRFVRRTPDPTIQLVRRTALDRVRRDEGHGTGFIDLEKIDMESLKGPPSAPALHARIATMNRATIGRMGVREVSDLLDDILRDRDESYRAALDRP